MKVTRTADLVKVKMKSGQIHFEENVEGALKKYPFKDIEELENVVMKLSTTMEKFISICEMEEVKVK